MQGSIQMLCIVQQMLTEHLGYQAGCWVSSGGGGLVCWAGAWPVASGDTTLRPVWRAEQWLCTCLGSVAGGPVTFAHLPSLSARTESPSIK